jgi:hypothetical protein
MWNKTDVVTLAELKKNILVHPAFRDVRDPQEAFAAVEMARRPMMALASRINQATGPATLENLNAGELAKLSEDLERMKASLEPLEAQHRDMQAAWVNAHRVAAADLRALASRPCDRVNTST